MLALFDEKPLITDGFAAQRTSNVELSFDFYPRPGQPEISWGNKISGPKLPKRQLEIYQSS